MRVLFASSPGLGHLFPMIPLAWALRSAGHDVLVATTGDAVQRAAQAGLPAVEAAPHLDVEKFFSSPQQAKFGDWASLRKLFLEQPEKAMEIVAERFAQLGDQLADGMLAAAQGWGPDLVVFEQMDSAGPFVAAKLGIPAVQHNFGASRGSGEVAMFAKHTAAYDRHGATRPTEAAAIIDIATAGLGTAQLGWPMRYVAYNAGGVLPEWLLAKRDRPRVCVTLGTVVGRLSGVGALGAVVEAAREVDAEFVFALGGTDASELGELPDNVRVAEWIPLNALLEHCDAIVHHGGSGSTFTSLTVGVPQLLIPHGADQFDNAKMVRDAGIGLWPEESTVDASHLARLLEDKEMRAACERLRAENAVRPLPSEVVAKLVDLVG
ncbi:nucleotide disphospho-sugar-binding domain-containing protein [Allokutzneria oryzae]|uniref:Nucleotide disphospho-sugar-binding domain-containing protein n=1 Tax=Allokutzneria oryzae TaxID=1378989 RepID=A0ABV5ZYV1_9PSEU